MSRSDIITYINKRFSLRTGKEAGSQTIAQAQENISFQGANLWILILAVIVCAIGLNMNSTAVVIGAMLISPLMGPIIGLGVGLAIYDMEMVRRGLRNLVTAFVLAIIVSGIYFWISPIQTATNEIIARTSPAIWDIGIAIAGGLVGAIALSRKEKSLTVVPGVAIATALMPPLCVAGYWLVQGDIIIALKSLYLLFINTVYIAGATFLVARMLHLPKKEYPDIAQRNKVQWIVYLTIIITAIPGLWMTKDLVQKVFVDQQFNSFTRTISEQYSIQLLQKSINHDDNIINLRSVGSYLDEDTYQQIMNKQQSYTLLGEYDLRLRQGIESNPNLGQDVVTPLLNDALESQEDKLLRIISTSLEESNKSTIDPIRILQEAQAIDPLIQSIALSSTRSSIDTTLTGDQEDDISLLPTLRATVVTSRLLPIRQRTAIESRLRTRTSRPTLSISWEVE